MDYGHSWRLELSEYKEAGSLGLIAGAGSRWRRSRNSHRELHYYEQSTVPVASRCPWRHRNSGLLFQLEFLLYSSHTHVEYEDSVKTRPVTPLNPGCAKENAEIESRGGWPSSPAHCQRPGVAADTSPSPYPIRLALIPVVLAPPPPRFHFPRLSPPSVGGPALKPPSPRLELSINQRQSRPSSITSRQPPNLSGGKQGNQPGGMGRNNQRWEGKKIGKNGQRRKLLGSQIAGTVLCRASCSSSSSSSGVGGRGC
ncbi:hypothetical protein KM043_009637 [Ampulex compressa]|nr:hypothetical protein KM043_009637 [Ampulex compressa]